MLTKNKADNLCESNVRNWQSLEMTYKLCYDDKQTEHACMWHRYGAKGTSRLYG